MDNRFSRASTHERRAWGKRGIPKMPIGYFTRFAYMNIYMSNKPIASYAGRLEIAFFLWSLSSHTASFSTFTVTFKTVATFTVTLQILHEPTARPPAHAKQTHTTTTRQRALAGALRPSRHADTRSLDLRGHPFRSLGPPPLIACAVHDTRNSCLRLRRGR